MIPLVPSILGLAAAVVLSFASGYKLRGDAEKARQLEVERGWHEKYKAGVAQAQAAAEIAGLALRKESSARADESAKLRAELGAARRSGTVRLATCPPAELNRPVAGGVTTAAVVAGEPDSVVSLTDDFRLRWDTALSLVVPSGDRAEWVASAGATPGAAGLWEVLDNITENASRWGQCREQMIAAQQWFRAMGWVR